MLASSVRCAAADHGDLVTEPETPPTTGPADETDAAEDDVESSREEPTPARAETAAPRVVKKPFEPEEVSWRRVLVGAIVIVALHTLLVFGIFEVAFSNQRVVQIALGFLPYIIGGLTLGLLTKGLERSLLEPFYASVWPALVFPFVVELMRVYATRPPEIAQAMARVQWLAALAPTLTYVLVAIFTCWLGERLLDRGRKEGSKGAPSESKV